MRTTLLVAALLILPFSAGGQVLEPDFSLTDINPGSVRQTTNPATPTVSPRQLRQQISAYYFSQEW